MLKLKARGPWYHVEGKNSLGVKIKRHSIHIAVYDKKGKVDKETLKFARAKVLELERATEWTLEPVEVPAESEGLKLIDAYHLWINQEKYPEGSSTRLSYSTVMHTMIEPLTAKGVVFVKDITSEHLRELQESWRLHRKLNTIHKNRKYTSCLFNFCVNFHDLAKNPWKTAPPIKEKKLTREEIMTGEKQDKGVATLPIDLKGHANWELIQANVPAYVRGEMPGQRKSRQKNPLFTHPETFLTLLRLMYETGLRRSDALIFRPDWIVNTRHGGRYTTVQVKTNDEVVCFIPGALVEALRGLPLLPWRGSTALYTEITKKAFVPGAGIYPFYNGSHKDHNNYLKNALDVPLRELGRLLFGRHMPSLRPHRFRDSFAVNQLNLGLALEDVRRLLGHRSIATTMKYYAPYVLGMQEAVMNRQAAAKQAALFQEALEPEADLVSVN